MLKRLLASLRGSPEAPAVPAPAPDAGALDEAGVAAWRRGDLVAAEASLRAALRAAPESASAYANLGMVLCERRVLDEGYACLRAALKLAPERVGLRVNLANALVAGNRMHDAIEEYRRVLAIEPRHARALANLAKPLLDVCDWDGAEALAADLTARWRAGDATVRDALTPFASLLYDLPPGLRLDVARGHAERVAARAATMRQPAHAAARVGGRLRIGYVSADLHDHATTHLAVGLFEHHDRDRFEVHAYSFGIDDGSAYRRRVVAAFEHFHELRGASSEAIAARIAADGIDVLVDLKGYTTESRPEIFALRPAPVQVSWLGYPGTMGAPSIDALIADHTIVPSGAEWQCSERIVRLPESYQSNDDRQPIAPSAPTRAACGLSEAGFVFACFNKHYKIERRAFAAWMRILQAVPGSVLWLLGGHGEAALRAAATHAGVDPARLVFAGKEPKPRHLARHACADLFLDTFTCNAHTTASDALWAGLPLLTLPGEAIAARVGASLVRAMNLEDAIALDVADYERRAIALARDPATLAALRARLAAARERAPLFDTARFTRNFEAVLEGLAAARPTSNPIEHGA
jgi:predicted O-linked N-acetylglucosamine transferase (SPINDLY family)